MPNPGLEPLVRRLMQEYLDEADAKIASGEWHGVQRYDHRFAVEHAMVPVGIEYFMKYYLHPEGRYLSYNTLFEEIADEYDDDWSLSYVLRIGSKKHPELAEFIPPKPAAGVTCSKCSGTGMIQGGEKELCACWECHGHGWNPAAIEALVNRTAEELKASPLTEEALPDLVKRFVDDGRPIFGVTKPLLLYFDLALQRAGLARNDRDPWIEKYLELVPEAK